MPVELGSRYTDDWSQKLMKLSDFIDGFVKNPQNNCGINPVGYLAQHPLFDQVCVCVRVCVRACVRACVCVLCSL